MINQVKKPNKNIISSLKYLWTSIETKGPFGWGETRRIENTGEKSRGKTDFMDVWLKRMGR